MRFALDDEIRPFSYEELNGQGRKLWFQIIQVDNVFVGDRGSSNDLKAQEQKADEWEVSYNRLIKVVEKIVGQYPELASAIDSNGRAALVRRPRPHPLTHPLTYPRSRSLTHTRSRFHTPSHIPSYYTI